MFDKEEIKLLLELIGNEQIHMIIKDSNKYESIKYKKLEALKIKIKDMWGDINVIFYGIHYRYVYWNDSYVLL